jgi:hypothetical protein
MDSGSTDNEQLHITKASYMDSRSTANEQLHITKTSYMDSGSTANEQLHITKASYMDSGSTANEQLHITKSSYMDSGSTANEQLHITKTSYTFQDIGEPKPRIYGRHVAGGRSADGPINTTRGATSAPSNSDGDPVASAITQVLYAATNCLAATSWEMRWTMWFCDWNRFFPNTHSTDAPYSLTCHRRYTILASNSVIRQGYASDQSCPLQCC